MRFFLLILSFNIFFQLSHAQGTLSGRVTSQGSPQEFVNVLISGTKLGATTDAEGRYQIANVPAGRYEVIFSAIGFMTSKLPVQVSGDTELNCDLKENVAQLEEVVVTGTLKEVSKMESSIPIEVYSPTLFRKNPTPNVFEALNLVNGVQPQVNCNVCNTGDIHINGLEGPYTMVLIDGMPIVSSLSTVYGLAGIPNSMIKRIEVAKGPASTLYGSEAVGGLINIITKEATNAARFQLDIFGTSVGEVNTDVAAAFKVGTASSLLGINHFQYNVVRDINNDNFTDVALQNRISIFNKWNFRTQSGRSSSIAGRVYHENRWGGELNWHKEYRGSDVVYGESIYTDRYELIGSHPMPGAENITLDYSYNFHHQDSYYGTTSYQAKQQVAFAQLRWNKVVGLHDMLVSMPYRYIFYDDNTPGTSNEAGTQNKPAITNLPGIMFQDEVRFSNKFTTLFGLRYDHHNIHGSIVTPRLSFKISPTSQSVIRLTGGRGFRVVNLFTEDHAALSGSRQVEILSDLKPEDSWNGNLNVVQNIPFESGFINLDGSLFYTYFTNKIVGDFITDPTKIIYDNLAGYAVSKGVALNADVNFANGIKALLGTTLLDVYQVETDVSDERIPQVLAPGISLTSTLGYTTPNARWAFDLTGRINSPMYMPVVANDFRPEKSPWVPLLNLQVSYVLDMSRARWEIYGGVKNLLNFVPSISPILHSDDPFDRPGGKYFDDDGNPRPSTNPFGYTFDTVYSYAPVQGLRGFVGVRYTFN
jgi:outer membrane receptor for ferrienterochelin and colicins